MCREGLRAQQAPEVARAMARHGDHCIDGLHDTPARRSKFLTVPALLQPRQQHSGRFDQ